MSVFRFLAVILFSLGLLVQGAAQASAMPQPQDAAMDCAEMSIEMSMDTGADVDRSADTNMPCKGMGLDCLVAMGCIGALALTDSQVVEDAKAVGAEKPQPDLFAGLDGRLIRPESPPPQANLTA